MSTVMEDNPNGIPLRAIYMLPPLCQEGKSIYAKVGKLELSKLPQMHEFSLISYNSRCKYFVIYHLYPQYVRLSTQGQR